MEQAYLPVTVRQRIQELIKERKITQAELAAEIGMAESTLSWFLSEKTDKIGDEYIIKIADFLGVSTDFILGQTDFPERRNYDIEELGLSYKAAMALYTREVDIDVVNRILESPQFLEITRMISRYFKDTIAEGFAVQNAMWDTLQQLTSTADTTHLANLQEGAEAVTQILSMMKTAPHERDVEAIQSALMTMLRDIKAGIQTQKKRGRKITAAIYEYLADCGGKRGELRYNFKDDTAEILLLAKWDTVLSHRFAMRAIKYLKRHCGEVLPEKITLTFIGPEQMQVRASNCRLNKSQI